MIQIIIDLWTDRYDKDFLENILFIFFLVLLLLILYSSYNKEIKK